MRRSHLNLLQKLKLKMMLSEVMRRLTRQDTHNPNYFEMLHPLEFLEKMRPQAKFPEMMHPQPKFPEISRPRKEKEASLVGYN